LSCPLGPSFSFNRLLIECDGFFKKFASRRLLNVATDNALCQFSSPSKSSMFTHSAMDIRMVDTTDGLSFSIVEWNLLGRPHEH